MFVHNFFLLWPKVVAICAFPISFMVAWMVLDVVGTNPLVQSLLSNHVSEDVWIGVSADISYHAALIVGAKIARSLQVDVHFPLCAILTTTIVSFVASLRKGVEFGVPIGLATMPQAVWKWYGRKKPEASLLKRPAAKGLRSQPAVQSAPPSGVVPLGRYHETVWGNSAHAGKKGSETFCGGVDFDATWDLCACRSLLLSLDTNDLKSRLQSSPWMLHDGIAPDSINWLKEAATGFSIQLRRNKVRKPKPTLIEEVMAAVAFASRDTCGKFAAQDAERRSNRLDSIRTKAAVKKALQHIPWASSLLGVGIEEERECMLLFECPEELRMGVVADFIQTTTHVPCIDAIDSDERIAARYVSSALGRSHSSSESGLQLTPDQVLSWEQVFDRLPCGVQRPSWREDAVFSAAVLFFDQHRHITAFCQVVGAFRSRPRRRPFGPFFGQSTALESA